MKGKFFAIGLLGALIAISAPLAFASGFNFRGINPQRQNLYPTGSSQFSCLDGSRTIAAVQINDDYCDCTDGSDEPGTSACGSTGTGFWCANNGWKSLTLPSSRVDDGICDCCDGTDEGTGVCANTCAAEAAAHAQQEAERKAKIARARAARDEAVAAGKEAAQRRREQLATLPPQIEAATATVTELRTKKEAAEEVERREAQEKRAAAEREFATAIGLHSLSAADLQDIIIGLALSGSNTAAREAVDSLRLLLPQTVTISEDDAASVAQQLESAELADLRREWTTASEAYNTSSAQTEPPVTPEELVALKTRADELAQKLQVVDAAFTEERYTKMLEALHISEAAPEKLPEVAVRIAAAISQSDRLLDLVAGARNLASKAELNAPEAPENRPAHVSSAAQEARDALTQAEQQLERLTQQKRDVEEEDRVDYGQEQEFYSLRGQCFSKSHAGATYQLCPFKEARQDSRSIGRWDDWFKQTDWHSKYRNQRYSNGDSFGCPKARSSTVQVECGESEEIIKVEEPEICVYALVFTCRAACVED